MDSISRISLLFTLFTAPSLASMGLMFALFIALSLASIVLDEISLPDSHVLDSYSSQISELA